MVGDVRLFGQVTQHNGRAQQVGGHFAEPCGCALVQIAALQDLCDASVDAPLAFSTVVDNVIPPRVLRAVEQVADGARGQVGGVGGGVE